MRNVPFAGRARELAELMDFLIDDAACLAIISGRRGIGKSRLVEEALKNCGSRIVIHACLQTSLADNAESLAQSLADEFGSSTKPAPDFAAVLDTAASASDSASVVIVLDNYPNLRGGRSDPDEIVSDFIDRWSGKCRVKLVLCGRHSRMRKLEDLLYGIAFTSIHLGPMTCTEAGVFYTNAPECDKSAYFAMFGGVPRFCKQIDAGLGVRGNILKLLADRADALRNLIELDLHSEFAKLNNANLVLLALSQGPMRFTELEQTVRVLKPASLLLVLDKLMAMDLVVKTSLTGSETNARKNVYRIADAPVNFYYRFIYRKAAFLSLMSEGEFYEKHVREDFLALCNEIRLESTG